jgi:hypothetical protein
MVEVYVKKKTLELKVYGDIMNNLETTVLLLMIPIIAGLLAIKYVIPIIERIFLAL